MKNLINTLVLCISLQTLSQNLECCKTIQEVKLAIEGDWKLKKGNQNITYRFIFNNNKGIIEVLEELNLPPKAAVSYYEKPDINGQTMVNVEFKNGVFFIKLSNLIFEVSEQIFVLNDEYFIYGNGASEHVFIRD